LTLAVCAKHRDAFSSPPEHVPTYRLIIDRLSAPVCRFAAVRAIAEHTDTDAPSGAHCARWRRAYIRASIARALAGASQRADPEAASVGALVYDIGGFIDPGHASPRTIELLEQSGVPDAIIEAVRWAQSGACEELSLDARVLRASDIWSRRAFKGEVELPDLPDVRAIAPELRPSRWRRIVREAVEDAERDLALPRASREELRDQAVRTVASLAERAFEEAERLRASMRELSQQVATDALTGVYSRLAFTQRFNEEMERAKRDGLPITLMLLDLDGFKSINDTHGHPAGDRYLTSLASVLQSCARRIDVVARYGGEEFAVILPHTNLAGASAIAERLRRSIESLVVEHDGAELRTTASIGSCTLLNADRGRITCGQLVEQADRQLYLAKRSGKNRAELTQIDETIAAAG